MWLSPLEIRCCLEDSFWASLRVFRSHYHFQGDVGRLHLILLTSGCIPLLAYYAYISMKHDTPPSKNVSQHTDHNISVEKFQAAREKSITDTAKKARHGGGLRRENLILDFVGGEAKYLSKLVSLRDKFYNPLANKHILTDVQLQEQFGKLDHFVKLHTNLRIQLKKVNRHGGSELLCKTLLRFASHLVIYSDYVQCFESSRIKRGALMSSSTRFSNFFESSDGHKDYIAFASLLIEPIERIQSFIHFFEKLNETCITDDSDNDDDNDNENNNDKNNEGKKYSRKASQKSIEKIDTEEALHLLRHIRSLQSSEHVIHIAWEDRIRVMKVMASLTISTRINLLDNPNRILVRECTLHKQCRKAIKPFRFWLFSDKIIYGEELVSIRRGTQASRYSLHREIDLVTSRISPVTSGNIANHERALRIECPAKSFIVFLPSVEECQIWLSNIRDYTEMLRKHMKDEQNIIAPIWVPDLECSKCGLCKTDFTIFTRRHHCRSCGRIVCGACSGRQWLLEHVDPVMPVRTCDECFGNLSAVNTPVGSPIK